MKQNELSQQEQAANMPLSNPDILQFQTLWQELIGERITLAEAAEHGRRLLALYKFVYRPMTAEQYQQLICKSQEDEKNE
ncbi:MAG: hypothetical protein A2509_03600 [Candidatus Edwardsbacteria bacterium RIFOXYD12_FULL_50_11]|uniref:Uncharacterized protein n=1 Tax=Candidatus Edwardsbacteria bacterium GWF2_54_11 TaxID=1817851 RepID=A0A1F5R7T1_9BACT|nr:MAG: hypothetical protein A2502_03515 [Candidatus Edwardsbacteria bacterium RifOxyC12_full_54_24]OGF07781.1 MAG: hypothetical protein A2273_04765 [Candidatus Edwardsbacteria bacterium RifOxyA12_full_54_48]OGF10029.1 MAG: hypothetical protein A3K15_11175 [Candidatus Edwardsbacteria bacterium GWE2_54_12]OGF10502.1 MAG: hypothetical protein A2024_09135 [Candidatus Edwardsbacteria bacterium GWF2_54_11]OGF14941.1 MAG: hypothetical protein A2509_03600 [Candidatus Edwardsbacteria bacterium RIFOXYD1